MIRDSAQYVLDNVRQTNDILLSEQDVSFGPTAYDYEAQLQQLIANEQPILTKEIIQIDYKPYSLSYLQAIQSCLNDYPSDLSIRGSALLQRDNCVEVYISEDSSRDAILSYLYESLPQFDTNAIKFVVSERRIALSFRLDGGSQLNYKNTSGSWFKRGTIGFSARDLTTKKYGIVTNAHVAYSNLFTNRLFLGDVNNMKIGEPSKSQFEL